MKNVFQLLFLLCFSLPIGTNAQILNEKLFADTEQKEGGSIYFHTKVADGVIIGGRFIDKEGFQTQIIKLDTLGIVKWMTVIPDSFNLSFRRNYESKVFSPILDSDGSFYFMSDILDDFNNTKKVSCTRLNPITGTIIWQKNLGIFEVYDGIKFINFDATTCSIFTFKIQGNVNLMSIQKTNGVLKNIDFPLTIPYTNTYRGDYEVVLDSKKNVYIFSNYTLFKLDANNGYKLLWSDTHPYTTYNSSAYTAKPYVDKDDKLYIYSTTDDTADKFFFYKLNPLNGRVIDSTVFSSTSFTVDVKESNDGIYFINADRYTGSGSHLATIIKYSKTSNKIVWNQPYSTRYNYSGIRAFEFDANGFIYIVGQSASGQTSDYQGDWTYQKINPSNGAVIYKYAVTPDLTVTHEISYGIGIYLFGKNAYMLGSLQTINSIKEELGRTQYMARARPAFIALNPDNGQVSNLKYLLGNYQFESKIEQIITSNDRILVVKQQGLKVDLESYNLDKRLVWTRRFETNYLFNEPIATVSPAGNIGLILKKNTYNSVDYDLNNDSLVIYALNKNGQTLWTSSIDPNDYKTIISKEMYFNDADNSIVQPLYHDWDRVFHIYRLRSNSITFLSNKFKTIPSVNLLEGNTALNVLQVIYGQTFRSLDLNKETLAFENEVFPDSIQVADTHLSVPLHNNRMLFGGNSCENVRVANALEFSLVNSKTYKLYWQNRELDVAECATTVLKMAVDKSEQYAYALVKRVDSVFLYKLNFLNGKTVFKKFIFNEKQAYELQDFVVSPSGDRLILTGTIVQNQYNGDYKNTFIRIFETTTGGIISYEIKKGELKGDNTLGKGIAFFPDDTYWIGGNIRKTKEGKAGVIYESKLSTQIKTITGRVFFDTNNNGTLDSVDIPLPNALVTGRQSKSYTFTDSLGYYTIYLNSTLKDTVSVSVDIKNAVYKPQFYVISTTDSIKNFPVSLAANTQDLRVSITEVSPPRPGFSSIYTIFYKNVGNTTITGKVRISLDTSIVPIIAAVPSLPLTDSLSRFWNFTNLKPNEERSITLYCSTSIKARFGTKFTTVAKIEPLTTDAFKADNIDSLFQTVVGSYDPNDKQVTFNNSKTPPSVIDASTELIYTIRFQNTGNYPADFVKVQDTLSDKLDLSTLRIITASHKYTASIGNKNVLTFDFNPIYLPDSIRDEKGSHGFVKFAIKPKKTLTKDEAIRNTGYIYFDYNPAIVTNTVETANQKNTSLFTPSVAQGILKLSPNPTQETLNFEIDNPSFQEGNLSIYDLAGRLILTKRVFNKTENLSVKNLNSGQYICVIQSNDGKIYVNKFIKVK